MADAVLETWKRLAEQRGELLGNVLEIAVDGFRGEIDELLHFDRRLAAGMVDRRFVKFVIFALDR